MIGIILCAFCMVRYYCAYEYWYGPLLARLLVLLVVACACDLHHIYEKPSVNNER